MFSLVSGIYQAYLAPTQINVLVVGASGVGKTSMLERIKVTQFSTRAKSDHQTRSIKETGENVPNVPVHWIKRTNEGENGNATLTKKDQSKDAASSSEIQKPQGQSNTASEDLALSSKSKQQRSSWLCPAPKRYAEAALQDNEDDDYVEGNAAVEALGNIPSPIFSRKGGSELAPAKTTAGSSGSDREESITKAHCQTSGDLGDASETTGDARNEESAATASTDVSIESPRPSSVDSTAEEQRLAEKDVASAHREDVEYDLKSKSKMLPLSKIRRTIGMNLGKITAQGVICNFWDLGGRMHELWERYYADSDAVIFVWKTPDRPLIDADARQEQQPQDDDDDHDDDDSRQMQVDYAHQLSLLEEVRSSIPDDVPFLVLGHLFSNVSSGTAKPTNALTEATEPQTDVRYTMARLLPHYHNPYQALFFANAQNGQGVRTAMEWLIPIAKRQLKLREVRRPVEGESVNK